MTKENTKIIEWKMRNGHTATVTIEHVTSETVYADGYNVDVACDKVEVSYSVPAQNISGSGRPYKSTDPRYIAAGAYATLGRIGFSEEIYNKINAAISEFSPVPATVPPAKHGAGWCEKCESYCYGDCDA